MPPVWRNSARGLDLVAMREQLENRKKELMAEVMGTAA